jgi:hypothetical protein
MDAVIITGGLFPVTDKPSLPVPAPVEGTPAFRSSLAQDVKHTITIRRIRRCKEGDLFTAVSLPERSTIYNDTLP